MECFEQITRMIYDAIGEVNEMLGADQAIEKSPDTVLIGETGTLDSVSFVTLAVAVEENVERIFNKAISVFDVIEGSERSQWTVGTLARSVAELVERGGAAS